MPLPRDDDDLRALQWQLVEWKAPDFAFQRRLEAITRWEHWQRSRQWYRTIWRERSIVLGYECGSCGAEFPPGLLIEVCPFGCGETIDVVMYRLRYLPLHPR